MDHECSSRGRRISGNMLFGSFGAGKSMLGGRWSESGDGINVNGFG